LVKRLKGKKVNFYNILTFLPLNQRAMRAFNQLKHLLLSQTRQRKL
jgi:hypothetical protein